MNDGIIGEAFFKRYGFFLKVEKRENKNQSTETAERGVKGGFSLLVELSMFVIGG